MNEYERLTITMSEFNERAFKYLIIRKLQAFKSQHTII